MVKIILIVVVILGFTYIGFGIASYYKKRNKFFREFVLLVDKLRAEIQFSQKGLGLILKDQVASKEDSLGRVVGNFVEYISNKDIVLDSKHLFKGLCFLKTQEKGEILNFFKSLGRHDSENEVALLDNFKEYLLVNSSTCSIEETKYGKMAIKISFLLGLMIAILLV